MLVRFGLLITLIAMTGSPIEPLERMGQLVDPAIREASGIVASRRHPGIYWVHNDSGNLPELFAVRRNGALVRSYRVGAPNVDWEDIATDDSGHLYLADTGNNKLLLPIRAVYCFVEPDPTVPASTGAPIPVLSSHYFRFADGERFDSEGLVIRGQEALLITKRRDGQPADVYRLPLGTTSPLLRLGTPERVGVLPGCVEPVTGASLTPDGRRLAVVTDQSVRIYAADPGNSWRPVGFVSFQARDVEAVCWDGPDLILASEDRSIYRLPAARWAKAR